MSAPVRMPSKTPIHGVSGSRGHYEARGKPRPIGVPGLTLCRIDQPATRHAPHNVIPGSPGRHDEVCSPGAEVGRRRAIGVIAAPPINPRATTPMARRWDPGTRKRPRVPEGRCREHGPEQRQRPGQWPYPYPWAIELTRVGTPPSPARRRRYKHRSALCNARVSRTTEPTRIGTPSGSAMRSTLPATRQAVGVPSAWSQPSQSTHARPRRWCDAGSPGRNSVTAAQKAGVEGIVRNSGR